MTPEPPPGQAYQPPPPPPESRPPDMRYQGLYDPLVSPQPPVRTRVVRIILGLGLAFGVLIGMFYVAKWQGWLVDRRQATNGVSGGQQGIQSKITYPVEPKKPTMAVNGGDPDADWKRKVDGKLREHDAKLLDHEQRLKALEGRTPPKPITPAQPPPATPKPKQYRSAQFVSNTIEDKKVDDPDAYVLAPGATKLACVVETAIHSDVDGYFTAKVRNNIYDTATGSQLVVPQGSTVLGKYHHEKLLFGNERIPTVSMTLALPNGKSVDLGDAPVIDQKGQAGLMSRVDQHWWRMFGAIAIMGVLRGGTQGIQTQITSSDPAGAVAAGIASSANQVGQMRIGPALSTNPTVYVDPGSPCQVLLIRELTLPAYVL
jgi:type IV secretory pathway VirB10-like protein